MRFEQRAELGVGQLRVAEARDEGLVVGGQRRRVAERDAEQVALRVEHRRREKEVPYFGEHARDAFAQVAHDAEVDEHAYGARVAADVDAVEREQLLEARVG